MAVFTADAALQAQAGVSPAASTDPQQLLAMERALNRTGALAHALQTLQSLPLPQQSLANPAAAQAALDGLSASKMQADIGDITAVLTKLMQEMRSNAQTQRAHTADAQINLQEKAAEKLKQAADKKFLAALVQGICQIAGGLIQMGASFAAMKNSIKGIKNEALFNAKKDALPDLKASNTHLETKITNLENTKMVAGKRIDRFENAARTSTSAAEKADYKSRIATLKDEQKSLAVDIKATQKELATSQQQIQNIESVQKIGDGKAYAAIHEKQSAFMNEAGKAAPGMLKGVGDIVAAKLNQEATALEKEAADLQTQATKANKSSQEEDDRTKKMQEMIESLRQNLAKIQASNQQINTQMALGQATV